LGAACWDTYSAPDAEVTLNLGKFVDFYGAHGAAISADFTGAAHFLIDMCHEGRWDQYLCAMFELTH